MYKSKKYIIFSIIILCGLYVVRPSLFSTDGKSTSSSSTSSTQQEATNINVPVKTPPRFLRAIILPATGWAETKYDENNVVTSDLATALAQKTAPVITTGPLLHNFFFHLKQLPQEEKEFFNPRQILIDKYKNALELKKTAPTSEYSKVVSEMADLEDALNELENTTKHLNVLLVKPTFNEQEWEIYKHINADLYLLIPLAYTAKVTQEWNNLSLPSINKELFRLKITKPELIIGFKIESTVLKKISQQALQKELDDRWGGMLGKIRSFNVFAKVSIDSIKEIFVQQNTLNPAYVGYWNIVMTGHGWLSRETYRNENSTDDPWARIAGLDLLQFQQLLSFCNRDINTTSLFIISCFVGGFHLDKINQYLKAIENSGNIQETENKLLDKTRHNYAVISSGITDVSVGPDIDLEKLSTSDQETAAYNFKNYFDQLELFFRPIFTGTNEQAPVTRQETFDAQIEQNIDTLATIVDNLSGNQAADQDIHAVGGTASIRLSKWNHFKTMPSTNVFVVDKKLITQHEAQMKSGQAQNFIEINDKKAIAFAVQDVPVSLIITTQHMLFPPVFVMQTSKKAPHIFEKIVMVNGITKKLMGLDEFLKFSIFQLQSPTAHLFFIKAVDCKNYELSGLQTDADSPLAIRNMWIAKTSKLTLTLSIKDIEGSVVFELNDGYYKGFCSNCRQDINWQKIDKKEFDKTIETMKKNLQ